MSYWNVCSMERYSCIPISPIALYTLGKSNALLYHEYAFVVKLNSIVTNSQFVTFRVNRI